VPRTLVRPLAFQHAPSKAGVAWRVPPHSVTLLTVLAALLIGLAIRLPFFLQTDFPLNDGGLFFVMAKEVAEAHYALPRFTTYNADNIPFAYPPLAFYLTALVAAVSQAPIIALLRYLPLLANISAIVVYVAVAQSILRFRPTVLVSAIIFVILPRSYEWMVMGGGLTRSFGFLFALLALVRARDVYEQPTPQRLIWCGSFAALAFLTHLEMGLFTAYSLALIFLLYRRDKHGLATSLWLMVYVVGLTAPWWLAVILNHGLAPYQAASATAGWSSLEQALVDLVHFMFVPDPVLSVVGGLAAIGILACALRRELFLPLWLLAIFVITPRSAPTEGTVPLAMLAGIGVAEVIVSGLRQAASRQGAFAPAVLSDGLVSTGSGFDRRSVAATLACMLVFGYIVLPRWLAWDLSKETLDALSRDERELMAWIAESTPPTSTFLVLSARERWEQDYVLEWFPALAQRKSLLTPQGAEWLPLGTHAQRVCLVSQVKAEGLTSVEALDAWAWRKYLPFSHVYVSKAARGAIDWGPLVASLMHSPRYTVLRENAGGLVVARTEQVEQPAPPPVALPLAQDCQTLREQPPEVQAAFQAAYGEQAPWRWVEEHNRQLGGRRG